VGVPVISVLVFTGFCIVCTVYLYCFICFVCTIVRTTATRRKLNCSSSSSSNNHNNNVNVTLVMNSKSSRIRAAAAAYHKRNRWHDLPRDVVHFKGDTYRQHYGVQFSNPVSVIHQTSWKCCVFLYLGFTAMLPNHLLNATVFHFLHLLVQKDQSPSEVWVHSQVS
jgi:hypothetical protein